MLEKSRNSVENILVFICCLVCSDVCNEEVGVLIGRKINSSINSVSVGTIEMGVCSCEGKVAFVQRVSKEGE